MQSEAAISDRHREILRAALRLFGERGYAGASLRELARRVGVQQPSLYHYFASKEELVEQVLDFAEQEFFAQAAPPVPDRLEDVPPTLARAVVFLYEHTDWRLFVRFLFSLSLSTDRYRPRLRALFADRAGRALGVFMQPFVDRGEISAADAQQLARMVLNAVGLAMIEQKILYPGQRGLDVPAFAEFVGRVAAAGLADLRTS